MVICSSILILKIFYHTNTIFLVYRSKCWIFSNTLEGTIYYYLKWRYHISIRQNLNIYKRLGNFKVSNNRCWINSLLVLLTFLYLEGHAFIFSCIILLEERLWLHQSILSFDSKYSQGITDNLLSWTRLQSCWWDGWRRYIRYPPFAWREPCGTHIAFPQKRFSQQTLGLIDNITFIYFS